MSHGWDNDLLVARTTRSAESNRVPLRVVSPLTPGSGIESTYSLKTKLIPCARAFFSMSSRYLSGYTDVSSFAPLWMSVTFLSGYASLISPANSIPNWC